MGPQDPKDVTRDVARDLSALAGELAALKNDANRWLEVPEYATLKDRLENAHAAVVGVPSLDLQLERLDLASREEEALRFARRVRGRILASVGHDRLVASVLMPSLEEIGDDLLEKRDDLTPGQALAVGFEVRRQVLEGLEGKLSAKQGDDGERVEEQRTNYVLGTYQVPAFLPGERPPSVLP